ncbi:VanZ family protein [Lacticaseibacillus nasuensis]|uniref:VanZ-like domain-containing protein n=1 Tax=Lacticaseibacillus nasuensis JCM 17158 TaxID=1291734 RepID=A0A0R1JT01_9LACO|nr:VanZ family protein [Lacticaseibacillus nasuensis]KRK74220.1 hypothetical protein FD02_GL000815 [Lacticaseibacillus nasuensis JCM 17158]
MLLLGPLYRFVAAHFATRINHFPLVRLVFFSVDKMLFYLFVFMVLRAVWGRLRRQPWHWRHEWKVAGFAGYLMLLLNLTVFRQTYWPWQLTWYWHRNLAAVNWVPLVETGKLWFGATRFDFWYQSLGNILWFVPFGWGIQRLARRPYRLLGVAVRGAAFSLLIEALQFLLWSGVADIDDVIFNTVGAMVGYGCFQVTRHFQKHFHA